MLKNNKLKIIISSIVILLPILLGLFLWNELPAEMPVHWGADGNADGFASKTFAVFFFPCLLLLIHLTCIIATSLDPKNKNQNNKVFSLIFWIVPVVSLLCSGMMYSFSLGKTFDVTNYVLIISGVSFFIIGNYLPKCKQNYTIGIKIAWTLENENNWNATHRACGKVWVVGSLILLCSAFLPAIIFPWVMIVTLTVMVVFPLVFSYVYYKKGNK